MKKRHNSAIFAVILLLSLTIAIPAFCASTPAAIEYLCELGTSFYRQGRYDDALQEFNKVLILDSSNQTAKDYIGKILDKKYFTVEPESAQIIETKEQEAPAREKAMERMLKSTPAARQAVQAPKVIPKIAPKIAPKETPAPKKIMSRDAAMNTALAQLKEPAKAKRKEPASPAEKEEKGPGLDISGETVLGLGVTSKDVIWKQANAALNEKDSRVLSKAAYNNEENTYDTRVYDRLRVNLDTQNKQGFNLHTNITVDPWSFTGKSQKTTIGTGTAAGDYAEIELRYWSNTRYTINDIFYTSRNGASMALPEIKVVDGETQSPIPVANTWGEVMMIPQLSIDRRFQPLRELWVDYTEPESFKLRVFPIAYQGQALTSEDPLKLSNNHIWWEVSPWLDRWLPGRTNPGAAPVDFTRGKWDDSLSFLARDSDGTRLTALRGFSFEMGNEDTAFLSTFASPKDLWQDYDEIDNVINATTLRHRPIDNLKLGTLFTYRAGFNEFNKKDVQNYVFGFDAGLEAMEGLMLSLEAATSKTSRDIDASAFKTNLRGNAYFLSLFGTYPRKSLMDSEYGYGGIKPEETDTFFAKYRFYAARLDTGFDPALATFRQTRRDAFWSRHIHFRSPMENYSGGLYDSTLKWEDIEPFAIGNGIDAGRDALGFRLETSMFDNRLDNLFDVRNVHGVNGKFIENTARDEVTYKVTDKLTSKLLGIYQKMPATVEGFDPFIYDSGTGLPLLNAAIEDGRSPSLRTGSVGLEYEFTEWAALSGIWERTNDYNLAYDNYPRGNLNTTTFGTAWEYGQLFRREIPLLYSQNLFPLPPYPLYDIWKAGFRFEPTENLDVYLDYTRNEFKSAGQIDDNINHIGMELAYKPVKKVGFFLRYTYSRWNDLNLMLQPTDHYYLGRHNFYTEFRYVPSDDDEFVLQYGESGRSPLALVKYDPFGGSLATLDTQHIVRMYYRRRF